jgi:uncharacterized membrane protein
MPQSLIADRVQTPRDWSRLIVVDFARVLAIIFMVQGHTLDVLLAPTYRQGAVFTSWLFLRGLTAPMFFTLSGVAFALSTMRRWDVYSELSPSVVRRLRRFGFYIVLGYVMHLPVRSFQDFRYLDAAGWLGWFQVDVLQCVGVTLVCLQALVLLCKTPQRFARWAAGVSAAVVLISPLAWKLHSIPGVPGVLFPYFTARTGSLFPLLPWSAFVFFGAALGYVFAQRHRLSMPMPIWSLLAGGASIIAAGLLWITVLPVGYDSAVDLWKANPGFFLIRGGCVCVLLAMLSWLVQRISIPQRATRSIAEESLVVYFVHVCILYGCVWFSGFRQFVGPTLSPFPTLCWIAVMVTSMLLLAWTWNWYKKLQPLQGLLMRSAAMLLVIGYGLK